MIKKGILKKIVTLGSYKSEEVNIRELFPDIKEDEFWKIYELCKPYTMTSVERLYALYCSVENVLKNKIGGVFVECGVWRGGCAMLIAKMLVNRKITDRKIYLYDTFDGMTTPSNEDLDYKGQKASDTFHQKKHNEKADTSDWCLANIAEVQSNMGLTHYPSENIFYIKGKVEDTIPQNIPDDNIAILRLDTDWYASTKHEMVHLYPLLAINGILIIDDYGHWEGCKKAVDEYVAQHGICILLNRVDYTCRVGVKTSA